MQTKVLLTQTLNSQDLLIFLVLQMAPNFTEIKRTEWVHFVFIVSFRYEDMTLSSRNAKSIFRNYETVSRWDTCGM